VRPAASTRDRPVTHGGAVRGFSVNAAQGAPVMRLDAPHLLAMSKGKGGMQDFIALMLRSGKESFHRLQRLHGALRSNEKARRKPGFFIRR
jgi:hypothetical protein